MKDVKVIENADELAALVRDRARIANGMEPTQKATLPKDVTLVIDMETGKVRVLAEGFANDDIHPFDLIRTVAAGYGVEVVAGRL